MKYLLFLMLGAVKIGGLGVEVTPTIPGLGINFEASLTSDGSLSPLCCLYVLHFALSGTPKSDRCNLQNQVFAIIHREVPDKNCCEVLKVQGRERYR